MTDRTLPSSSKKAEASRRDRETEEERKNKKRKTGHVTFSDPTALVTLISGEGEEEAKFSVHKEVACRHSKVLRVAFESSFIEGQTQTYRFPESSEQAVRYLMQYMYTQNLVVALLQEDWIHNASTASAVYLTFTALIELWALGDMLLLPKLQNLALLAYEAVIKKTKNISVVHSHHVNKLTSPGSMLRKYSVQIFVFRVGPNHFVDQPVGAYPNDILMDIIYYMKSAEYQKMTETERASYFPKASSFFVPEDTS